MSSSKQKRSSDSDDGFDYSLGEEILTPELNKCFDDYVKNHWIDPRLTEPGSSGIIRNDSGFADASDNELDDDENQDPGSVTNPREFLLVAESSVPPDRIRYRGYSGFFMSVSEAKERLYRPRWEAMQDDDTVPLNDDEMMPFVANIYDAITDLSGFIDKIESRNKVNKMVAQLYEPIEIEARCWQAVDIAVKLHLRGATIPDASDPTKADRGGSRTTIYSDRSLTFRQRIVEICRTVKLCKSAATDVLDGMKIHTVVYAPILTRKTKRDNKKNNDSKQRQLTAARALRRRLTESIIPSIEPVEPVEPAESAEPDESLEWVEDRHTRKRRRLPESVVPSAEPFEHVEWEEDEHTAKRQRLDEE